jgi:hypothetical protein
VSVSACSTHPGAVDREGIPQLRTLLVHTVWRFLGGGAGLRVGVAGTRVHAVAGCLPCQLRRVYCCMFVGVQVVRQALVV